MFQYSIAIGACFLLTMLSGARAQTGLPACWGFNCVQPYRAYPTQNNCVQEIRPPQWDCRWRAGMDFRADEIIYGGSIAAYRILWYPTKLTTYYQWSGWFLPGFNDFDPRFNPTAVSCPGLPGGPANGLRRVWSYFYDHYHTVIICYSPVKCSRDTSRPPIKGVLPDPYIPGIRKSLVGVDSGPVDFANVEEVASLKAGARVDELLHQDQVDSALDLSTESVPTEDGTAVAG